MKLLEKRQITPMKWVEIYQDTNSDTFTAMIVQDGGDDPDFYNDQVLDSKRAKRISTLNKFVEYWSK